MSKEVANIERSEVAVSGGTDSFMGIIQMAMEKDINPESLEKLLALHERNEANISKKAYVKAMSQFKANPPKIVKDTLVDFATSKGRTTYKHAALAQVAEKVGEALSNHGLTASWKTDQADNGNISVTCCITHELGHSESTTLVAGPDTSGGKNSIQGIGSAVSYLQRYTLLAICGLATFDDDGQSTETVNAKQLSTLTDLMAAHVVDESKFLAFWSISELSELWAVNFDKACAMIKLKPVR